ncbi:MAG: hypothetical protein L6R43_00545 [Planctomycetes bacterium]|nr:hypothetical protein [Planctomycetota bacterium]
MRRWFFAALILSLFLVAPFPVQASQPEVFSIVEGRDATSGRPVIMVFGTRLTAFKTWSFNSLPAEEGSELPLHQISRSRTALVFALKGIWGPADAQDFRLTLSTGKTDKLYDISLRFGKAEAESVGTDALATSTRDDVDDAAFFDGKPPAYFLNAGNLTWPESATVPLANFSAWDDIQAEGRVGTSAAQVAQGDHTHDAAYAALSHGHDDRYALLTHEHDARYDLRTDSLSWNRLTGMPDGFADGADDTGPAYSAGNGLALTATTFSVAFGGNGAATTVCRSDHSHDASYLQLIGGTLTGTLVGPGAIFTGGTGIGVLATSSAVGSAGVYGGASGASDGGTESMGVYGTASGSAKYGVLGFASTTFGVGVQGQASGAAGTGVSGVSSDSSSATIGVLGRCASAVGYGGYFENTATTDTAYGLYVKTPSTAGKALLADATATSGSTFGIQGRTSSSSGIGVMGECTTAGTGVWAQATGSGNALIANLQNPSTSSSISANIAVFKVGTTNKARIDRDGVGYFNGGTQNSGADVAESVVAAEAAALEPGDVLVIDPKAPRRFARSSAAESRLVAGVYATRPGVLLRKGGVTEGIPEDEVPLAVVGIVPTKVCDEGGPIAIGDLLVTASMPGHAKKAGEKPMAGTVLGKALGALDKGDGVIEVLLMAR